MEKTIKQRGGKREGAGRKKARHTIATEKAREYLVAEVVRNLKPIVEAMIDSAKGLSYINKQGRIYTQIPNARVGEYLLNQVAGKAPLSVDMTNSGNTPFIIRLDE